MSDTQFEVDSWQVEQATLLDPLQRGSVSRRVFPINNILTEKDKRVKYWKHSVDFNTNYRMDPSGVPLAHNALEPVEVNVPLIQYGFGLDRADLARAKVSKLSLDQRLGALAPYFARDEDEYAILGSAEWDVTSFADTTNNSTATGTELNVTTEALTKSTMLAQIDELAVALGGGSNADYEQLKGRVIGMGLSNDVHKKMVQTGLTAGGEISAEQRLENILDLGLAILKKFGAPGSFIWASPFLGGSVAKDNADKRTLTAGSTNSVMYVWGADVLEIYSSPFNTVTREDAIDGKVWNFTERWVPEFKQTTLVRYGGTAVIA